MSRGGHHNAPKAFEYPHGGKAGKYHKAGDKHGPHHPHSQHNGHCRQNSYDDIVTAHINPADEYTGFAIHMKGDFGKAELYFQQGCDGHPVQGPVMAAWSALALLKRLTSPISF